MIKRSLFTMSFLLLVSGTHLAYADEDRDTTPAERAKVGDALKKAGCPTFGDVDFYLRTEQFNADDVICNDNKKYEVYLDKNFNIVSKREDRD